MTSFIEEQEKLIPATEHGPVKDWDRIYVQRTISYCRFLRQPLTLGMFVPVDEKGEYWESPTYYGGSNAMMNDIELEKWNKAQEKVLFEGFEYLERENFFCVLNNDLMLRLDRSDFRIKTIESISNECLKLTPSALKQIGL